MTTAEKWSDAACESCPHQHGYNFKYQCPFCLPALFTAAIAESRREAIEECAKVADAWAENYPVSAWPEGGESLDCKSAEHGRHSSRVIARDIRALAAPTKGRT